MLLNNTQGIFVFHLRSQQVYTMEWWKEYLSFHNILFQFSKLRIKINKYIPEKLATWVHSSITPFMNLKDSLCKVSLLLLLFILCPCWLFKFLLLLLLVENVWFMHCILGASCIKSLSDEALGVLLFVVKLWTASLDTDLFEESRLNILEVTSMSSSLSTLSGKFLTKSCPILKESV